ncbi:dsDNA nuclease domain-containing protein [Streptomyces sp. NBC_00597]|uniref:dsDNA nuclease domain-containing protein n=1 Tax=Streptomyces sp. NBC_00597 TaxID=2975786 RepID=UPI0030E5A852
MASVLEAFVGGQRDISDLAKMLITEPVEDSGSDTASRYNFQYQCAARHCFAMLNDSQLSAIICEWHVDYILAYHDGTYELVSVKHREPNLGPWSFSDLWNRGGLATLYDRWKINPESSCRLVTNGALKSTQGDALSFATDLTSNSIDSWVRDVANRLTCNELQAKSFLLKLRIEHGIPDRVTLRSHEIITTVEKSLRKAQIGATPSAAWDSLVALVAIKSRDLDNRHFSSIDLASPEALNSDTLISSKVSRRTIRRVDVVEALSPAGINSATQSRSVSNTWSREPASNFVGRREVLDQITAAIDGHPAENPAIALIGMSGVGKSELLAQYAWRHENEYEFIWWVRADSWGSMSSDLTPLCEKLGLSTPESSDGIQQMKEYFRTHRGLILIDGAPADHKIANFIPRVSAARFIISSLDQRWVSHVPTIQVLPLPEDESQLLLSGVLTTTPQDDLAKLSNALHGLPLALKQAAGYISASGISPSVYSEMVRSRTRELLDRSAPPEHMGLTATLSITIDRLREQHPSSLEMLGSLSYVAPTAFPSELFGFEISRDDPQDAIEIVRNGRGIESIASAELSNISASATLFLEKMKDPLHLFDSIADLQKFSLLDAQQTGISCHALTQAVVRGSLTESEQKASVEAATKLVHKVARYSPVDSRNWPHYRQMLPHFEALIEHTKDQGQLISATLMFHVAISMNLGAQGSSEGSLFHAQQAVDTFLRMDSLDANIGATVQTTMIDALAGADRWNEALRLADEALAVPSQLDSESIAALRTHKALVLRLMGRLGDAVAEYDAVHAQFDSIGPQDNLASARAAVMANMATLRREMGDAKGAAAEFEKLISDYPEDSSRNGLATLYSNLGLSYLEATRFEEALTAAQRALEISFEIMGGLHRDAARDWNNAGLALLELRRPDKAAEAFEASLHIHERLNTRQSSAALIVQVNLGRAQMAQGEMVSACATLEAALKRQEKIVGSDHREVAATLTNLTVAYTSRRQFGNAVAAANRAIKIDVMVYGDSHPELLADYHNMASALLLGENYRAARKWFMKAYKISTDNFGQDSLRAGTCLYKIAICDYSSGSIREGVNAMREAISILEVQLPADHFELKSCRGVLSRMLQGKAPGDVTFYG